MRTGTPPLGQDADGYAAARGRAKEIEHANDFELCRRGIAIRPVCGVWPEAARRLAAASHGADGDGSIWLPAAARRVPATTRRVSPAHRDLCAAARSADRVSPGAGSDGSAPGCWGADGDSRSTRLSVLERRALRPEPLQPAVQQVRVPVSVGGRLHHAKRLRSRGLLRPSVDAADPRALIVFEGSREAPLELPIREGRSGRVDPGGSHPGASHPGGEPPRPPKTQESGRLDSLGAFAAWRPLPLVSRIVTAV